MFKIVFKKQVHSCFQSISSGDVFLHRLVEMPFVPPVGMEVYDGDWSATVEKLCWKDGTVYAITTADKELYDADLRREKKKRSIEEVVAEYTHDGWAVGFGVLST